jgi:hypothetical protein
MSDTKLIVAFAVLHAFALAPGGGLLLLASSGGDGYDPRAGPSAAVAARCDGRPGAPA